MSTRHDGHVTQGFRPTSLIELLRWRADNQPSRRAYTFLSDGETEKASLTYGELDRRARAIAAALQTLKAEGERALLLYPPGLDYIAAFFGCLYAGVIAVPAYPPFLNRNLSRLEAIAANAQAKLALTTSPILSKARRSFADAEGLSRLHWVSTDGIAGGGESEWRETGVRGDALAFLQYTSGSTGTPRGVMLSHDNLLNNMAIVSERFGLDAHRQGVAWQPLFHDMGLIGMVLNPLYAGFPMALMSPLAFLQHPFRWLQAISRYGATYSGAPSFAYDFCVRAINTEQCESLDLSRWSLAAVGAEPIRKDSLDRFAETFAPYGFRREAYYPCYGLAEATLIVSGGPRSPRLVTKAVRKSALEQHRVIEAVEVDDDDAQLFVGCGRALSGQRVVVVNPESREACAPGEVGEIWVSGPSVARGYWGRPEETEETFKVRLARGGEVTYLRTGDLGFVGEGEIYITGRLKDLIIIRGLNHYPQDIEHTVQASHAALRPACGAAFSVDAAGEERLVVVQELESDSTADSDEVVESVRYAVAEQHEVPVYAVVLVRYGTIPMTSSGKIQRRACRTKFLEGSLEDVVASWSDPTAADTSARRRLGTLKPEGPNGEAVPRSAADIKGWLISRLSRRLGVGPEEIDSYKPFAAFGLDSAEAVGLSAELGAWLGRSLPPTLAWNYPNIEGLSAHLAGDARGLWREERGARQRFTSEPIAIIGLGCRFPRAPNPEAFWRLLEDGTDAITEVPFERWDANRFYDPQPATPGKMNTRWGGFLERVEQFDPQFFGISPREADRTDPQQRLLLEVAWEALEDAALAPHGLAGTRAGVFVGISSNDYARLLLRDVNRADVYDGTGNALSIAANRLSYFLDLRGPSVAVDTACSSSLVAIHMACQSLRAGESNLALAGGVNLTLVPEVTINLSQSRMMSSDGRCKPFDSSADGYVRGEGCGVLVLKRLSEALADGDRIHAVIRGTAINQDGRSNGLTAPSGPAQQEVVRMALEDAGVTPAQVSYVEAHGSGTPLGDPIEFHALEAVLREGRAPDSQRCAVGSVKTNIGHLEAAAGVAGLIKVVLSLAHETIPRHLHLRELNPHISPEASPLEVPAGPLPWPSGVVQRFAGVSSFGFGGTNAHVILGEPPPPDAAGERPDEKAERPLHVLSLSAHTGSALRESARRFAEHMKKHADMTLADVCYTANVGRANFPHRMTVVADSPARASAELEAFSSGGRAESLVSGYARGSSRPKVAFLFTGQGAQYVGMGHELYQTQPAFREALERCAGVLDLHLERPLLSVIYPAGGATSPLNETAYAQPALFAVEYALAELWRSWGVTPDAVLGHSVGEYVAACVAGVFGLEDALKLIAERGRLMQETSAGAMAVVFESASSIAPVLARHPGRISIAAVNGPSLTVVSGAVEAVRAVREELEAGGVKTQELSAVTRAFHSPLVEPVLDAFESAAGRIQSAAPSVPLVSNLTGRALSPEELLTADYWRRHAREAVQFDAGVHTLAELGCEVFVEIGPSPTLIGMGKRCLSGEASAEWLPSLRRGGGDWRTLLGSLAALYVRGRAIDWAGFDRDYRRRKVSLPTYPFERQRCWFDSPGGDAAAETPVGVNMPDRPTHPLLGRQLRSHPVVKPEE